MTRRIEPLANAYITVYASDVEKQEFVYTPGVCVLPGGRLIVTMDHKYPGISQAERGMVFLSDDGEHFRFAAYFPFVHGRPFVAGDALYIIGVAARVGVVRSDDGGETWSAPAYLTEPEGEGCGWHSTAANVWYTADRVYLAMEHRVAA